VFLELFYEVPDHRNLISGVSAHYIPHQISILFLSMASLFLTVEMDTELLILGVK